MRETVGVMSMIIGIDNGDNIDSRPAPRREEAMGQEADGAGLPVARGRDAVRCGDSWWLWLLKRDRISVQQGRYSRDLSY